MEPLDILRADPLDLLFEHRNKSYGAYPLRKYYTKRLLISLGFVFFLLLVFSFLLFRFSDGSNKKKFLAMPDVFIESLDLKPLEKPVLSKPRPASAKPRASVEQVTPIIVKDQQVPRPMASIEEPSQSAIELNTTDGKMDNGQPESNGPVAGPAARQKDSAEGNTEIFGWAEVMPEFPGGEEALKRFLQKNLRMPENNLKAGSRVKVIARFVVGSDGRVRDIEITQAADEVFNKEVKRVIIKMPDWKPGMQHKRKVAVYFSLPVNFIAEE
jgi:periplasmic protein TonB